MNRDELIAQVKREYAKRASEEFCGHATQHVSSQAPFKAQLSQIIAAISFGRFDTFQSGGEIMNAVDQAPYKWLF